MARHGDCLKRPRRRATGARGSLVEPDDPQCMEAQVRKVIGYAAAGAVLATGALLSQAALAGPVNTKADVLVLIDESGSMGGEQAWIGPTIGNLDSALQAAGVTDSRYGLVGYGSSGSGELGRSLPVGGGQFGTAAEFATATGSLVTSGSDEDGYSAIDYALDTYSFREGAAVNFILITDEDRDNLDSSLTFESTRSSLASRNILLNAIVDNPFEDGEGNDALGVDSDGDAYLQAGTGFSTSPGGTVGNGDGNTEVDYVQLALELGGAAWDLNNLRAGGDAAEAFTNAFIDIKVQEISEQPTTEVPEPATLALVGAGLLGLGAGVRRRGA